MKLLATQILNEEQRNHYIKQLLRGKGLVYLFESGTPEYDIGRYIETQGFGFSTPTGNRLSLGRKRIAQVSPSGVEVFNDHSKYLEILASVYKTFDYDTQQRTAVFLGRASTKCKTIFLENIIS